MNLCSLHEKTAPVYNHPDQSTIALPRQVPQCDLRHQGLAKAERVWSFVFIQYEGKNAVTILRECRTVHYLTGSPFLEQVCTETYSLRCLLIRHV